MTTAELKSKNKVVEALIEEYLKPSPNKKDVKKLMEQLDIQYSQDDLVNMKAVLDTYDFVEKER
jgi:hypothetical protein